MIVCMANSISRAQQGLTLPVPVLSANKLPFAKLSSFSAIVFTAISWWGCNCVGLWSSLKVLVSMVMPNTSIDSSKYSLWNSWLSLSYAYLWLKISFILIFRQQPSSDNSSDSCSDSSWQRLWQQFWQQVSSINSSDSSSDNSWQWPSSNNSFDSSSESRADSGWAVTTTRIVTLTAAELWQ